jgi:2,3-bisphosphoglycerate-dependent phosphoglycerate mutase
MQLYIIRHAQSVNNALLEDITLRVRDPELTEVGHKQAQFLAQYLSNGINLEDLVTYPADAVERTHHHPYQFTHLYCSAMHRSMQTARPVADALSMPPEIWVEVHEHGGIYLHENGTIQGYGGLTRSQIESLFPTYTVPEVITEAGWWNPDYGQEDITSCHARAMRVAENLRQRATKPEASDETVAIVTHGTFIDSLLKAFTETLPGHRYFHWHYNTGITRLDLRQNGQVVIRYINRVTHLPAELIT